MINRVSAQSLPAPSALSARLRDGDFVDSFSCTSDLSPRMAADIGLSMPRWVMALMGLRNLLVRPFGLKTEITEQKTTGIFPVLSETADELILGTEDKHLDFLISILRYDGRISFSTWVRPHNFGGKAYLAAVMPFHKLIVRDSLKRVARFQGA